MVIIVKFRDFWVADVGEIEPTAGATVECTETGGKFRFEFAGSLDSRAEIQNKRMVSLYPISGDSRLQVGWHITSVADAVGGRGPD